MGFFDKSKDWTDEELEAERGKYERQKQVYEQRKEIEELKRSCRWHISTTKLIMAFLLINCTAVEVYSMVAMWRMWDLSALYSLITAVVTESLSFAVYAAKAYNETKQEEQIKLERERMMLDHSAPEMDEAGDPERMEG